MKRLIQGKYRATRLITSGNQNQAKACITALSLLIVLPRSIGNSVDFPLEQTYLNFIDEQAKSLPVLHFLAWVATESSLV
ncbi:hypothetical protein [Massilia agri]|uniref:Uncharacterized protein n=1 Tax=Massilia agri TaxID=1886785 RepID=A0ABT2AIT5_9BURK|nr:hypothetical protein [Massilia agri]MCS0596152.1 hypothetical protein [Massilia agri]